MFFFRNGNKSLLFEYQLIWVYVWQSLTWRFRFRFPYQSHWTTSLFTVTSHACTKTNVKEAMNLFTELCDPLLIKVTQRHWFVWGFSCYVDSPMLLITLSLSTKVLQLLTAFFGYLQFWKSFPSCPRFRSAEVKMAGGIISRDLALAKMGARGRISRELTILLKEPPLGCFANLKVFYPRMKRFWKGGSFVNPIRPWGGPRSHICVHICANARTS